MMSITARAPVRVSFGGGGTDLEAYYARFGGLVVSTAIARYAAVTVSEGTPGRLTIRSVDYGRTVTMPLDRPIPIEEPLPLARAAVAHLADRVSLPVQGLSLSLRSEVPPGTGLGSSSAMAVALVRALSAFLRVPLDRREVAEMACAVEIERLGLPIGKQDQYASAFGGLNVITFGARGVRVEPLRLAAGTLASLDSRLLLFSTGTSRRSSEILSRQRADTATSASVAGSLHRIKELATEMRAALTSGDLDTFGTLLDHAWQHKKSISGRISNGDIDRWYAAAREAGAPGGKITGAGGGGHLLLYCREEKQPGLRAAMKEQGLKELRFRFDTNGVQVVPGAAPKRMQPPATSPQRSKGCRDPRGAPRRRPSPISDVDEEVPAGHAVVTRTIAMRSR